MRRPFVLLAVLILAGCRTPQPTVSTPAPASAPQIPTPAPVQAVSAPSKPVSVPTDAPVVTRTVSSTPAKSTPPPVIATPAPSTAPSAPKSEPPTVAEATPPPAKTNPPQPPPPVTPPYSPKFRDLSGSNGGLATPMMTAMKVGWIRSAVIWQTVEPSKGTWSWASTDAAVSSWLSQGYGVTLTLEYTAPWASSGSTVFSPATNLSDWTDYVTAVVSRYTAAPYNLKYFQVWNEPTIAAGFWKGKTDLAWIDQIYLPSAKIIRANGAYVVIGGWPDGGTAELNSELNYENAWQWTDILDIHYMDEGTINSLYLQWIATGKCRGIWQTEIGYRNDPAYVKYYYDQMFYWASTQGHWTFPEQYKMFWWPAVGQGCSVCMVNVAADGTQTLTANGQALAAEAAKKP